MPAVNVGEARVTFALERERLETKLRRARLADRETLTPGYVRVRLEGAELTGFGGSGHDDHIRVFFPGTDAESEPESVEQMREAPSREFTPLTWGTSDEGTPYLDLEFVLHGDEGVAGPWAANAPLGSLVAVGGPRGSLRILGTPDAWLLAGDETAIPQIRRYAALITEGAPARVLVEVTDAAHEVAIESPAAVEYVHRGHARPGTALAAALGAITADERPDGDVFAFVAAEQSIVKVGRALLCDRWGIDSERVVVKGYWQQADSG